MKVLKTVGLGILMALVSCGPAANTPSTPDTGTVTNNNSPVIKSNLVLMDANHKVNFDELPLEGTVESSKRFWSGDHWPLNRGIINRRWNTPEELGFDTVSPTKEELQLMSLEEVSRLSPSEKYDLLLAQYNYPLKTEVAQKANPVAVHWEGLGNGWAVASSNHPEPEPKILINPDGISIPFGSCDIKALLSYYYTFASKLPTSVHLGLRCTVAPGNGEAGEGCENDLNAGSFHVTLANKIGLQKESFLADIDRYQEVWNHPFQSYRSQVVETIEPAAGAPEGTVKTMKVKTKVYYVDKAVGNSWDPIKGSYRQVTTNRVYHYDLHLNAQGEIIGGDWKSSDRPDFLWTMPPVEKFEGYLEALGQLIH